VPRHLVGRQHEADKPTIGRRSICSVGRVENSDHCVDGAGEIAQQAVERVDRAAVGGEFAGSGPVGRTCATIGKQSNRDGRINPDGRGSPRRECNAAPLLEHRRRAALSREPGVQRAAQPGSLALLLAHLGLKGGENVLEIGCGTEALTLPLAEAVGEHGRVVAVDISEPMLGAAR
jgi:hypothetical protein